MTYTVSGGALNSAQSNPKPYQGNKLFLYIVCAIAVTVDRILWNMFTSTFYFVKILAMTSLIAS